MRTRYLTVDGTVEANAEMTRQDIYRSARAHFIAEQQLEGDVITLAFVCEPNDH
ncbi:hypothetical protein ABZ322_13680 [Streptomyces sp. NPDC006129]|uniref:hypothetical protein n=1 Tax=Streptomyces sp. NPDC006129 TaxID=3155348 RepID=UPI0033B5F431